MAPSNRQLQRCRFHRCSRGGGSSNLDYALWTVITSYVLWGIGLPLALMVMVIYLARLALHKLPPKAVIVSVFLPLGPLGQGSLG